MGHIIKEKDFSNPLNVFDKTRVLMKRSIGTRGYGRDRRGGGSCGVGGGIYVTGRNGKNICRIYNVGIKGDSDKAAVQAHQITLIPRMLKLIKEVSSPNAKVRDLRKEAKSIIEDISGHNMEFKHRKKERDFDFYILSEK